MIITANSLGVRTTAGNIILTNGNLVDPNNTNGVFAAMDTAGMVKFKDVTTGVLTVGTVSADPTLAALFAATAGVITSTSSANGNDVTLSTGGVLTIGAGAGEAINAGTGTVRLSAGGTVSENAAAASIITANALGVQTTAGNIILTNGNLVDPNNTNGTFAASDTAAGGFVKFEDATTGTLTVGTVSVDPTSAALFAATAGVTTTNGGTSTNGTASKTGNDVTLSNRWAVDNW